ncbi:MAG: GlxA family transcriptional regulator [Kiloniellales bacterium]
MEKTGNRSVADFDRAERAEGVTEPSQDGRHRSQETETFGFLLLPQFSLLAFTSAMEPLRAANRLSGRALYAWHLVSKDGAAVASSGGIEVLAQDSIDAVERLPNLLVVTGLNAHLFADRSIMAWLRRIERRGCRLGALSTGSYVLARAGLLTGYRCTIHWETLAAFREAYPDLEVTAEVYEIDRGRLTCSGGTAALDLMLSLITLAHGRGLATAVAEQFIHERIRGHGEPQRMALRNRLGVTHPRLLKVVGLMEENLEEPLSRAELARRAGISTRQLERLFRKYLQRTPTRYYLELRLYRARRLLGQTAISVLGVALACGFVSASHFSKCYREFFHKTPREERLAPH